MITRTAFETTPMTYGRLSEVLIRLGYARKDTPEYMVFKNPEADALIALPLTRPDEKIRPAHVLVAKVNAEGKGILSAERFLAMMARPARRTRTREAAADKGKHRRTGTAATPSPPAASD